MAGFGTALLLAMSAVSAGIMGFAVQRGATCMVAALEEVVERHRFNRLLAMLEASAVVAGGLVLARVAGLLPGEPAAWQLTGWSVLGGALLGLGAFVARACVFGSIAKLGSGDWAYLAVPPGFFLGCIAAGLLLSGMAPQHSQQLSPILTLAPVLLAPFAIFAAWRVWKVVAAARQGMFAAHVWSPHVATSVIGLAFVVLLLCAGPWSYTEALAEAAMGKAMMSGSRVLLFAALFGGALLGGWTAGRLSSLRPTLGSVLRCLGGGALMGMGSVLIPGSNDGLILIGLPLLHAQAWVALSGMAVTIIGALLLRRSSLALSTKMA